MAISATAILDLVIGLLEVGLAAIVLVRLWRFRGTPFWLALLAGFFVLRGAERIASAFLQGEPVEVGILLDTVLLAVLVLLIFGFDRLVRGIALARKEATIRGDEYSRALVDYRRLVRHRLANPLTAIIGSVRTLQDVEPLDAQSREQLLDVIAREADRLEHVSLDPRAALGPEEHDLRPTPTDGA